MVIHGGISIGPEHDVCFGTLGLVLNDNSNPQRKFLITADHVLATSTARRPFMLWHPFSPLHPMQNLGYEERLVREGLRLRRLCLWDAGWTANGPLRQPNLAGLVNIIDALEDYAAVEITSVAGELKVAEVVDIGRVTEAAAVNIGDHVRMYGANSEQTLYGKIARTNYPNITVGGLPVVSALLIQPVGDPPLQGDSGAVWVNSGNAVVGLHLGTSHVALTPTPQLELYAVAIPIARVLRYCNLAFPPAASGCVVQ